MVDASFIENGCNEFTSRQNAEVKQLRQMFHLGCSKRGGGEIAIEGMHLVRTPSAPASGPEPCSSASRSKCAPHKLLPKLPSKTETLFLPDDVFASAVPTETPQGVAVLVTVKSFDWTTYCELSPH